jgi:type II secretory pathway component PulF
MLGVRMRFAAKDLATFYFQLGTMTQSGVALPAALHSLRSCAPRRMRQVVSALADVAAGGEPLHAGLEQFGHKFDALDRHAIAVSERSGALDVGLLSLSRYHDERAAARRRLVAAGVLPVLLLAAAVFISRLPALVLGFLGHGEYGVGRYLADTLGVLGLVAAGGFGLWWAYRASLQVPGLNLAVERVARLIPVVGRVRFDYALSQWLASIRMMCNAGFGVVQALEVSSNIAHSPLLSQAWQRARPLVNSQLEVSQALAQAGVFPEELIQCWATGEQSGRLDEMLERLARQYAQRWRRSLEQLTTWLPRLAYALVSVYIIVQILRMMQPIFDAYRELLQ